MNATARKTLKQASAKISKMLWNDKVMGTPKFFADAVGCSVELATSILLRVSVGRLQLGEGDEYTYTSDFKALCVQYAKSLTN